MGRRLTSAPAPCAAWSAAYHRRAGIGVGLLDVLAITDEELVPGLHAIGAPVRGEAREVVVALSMVCDGAAV